jgi:hypothetical protein
MGGATGHGVYLHAQSVRSIPVLKEEILHEAERRAVTTSENLPIFTWQPEWHKAIGRDIENSKGNPVYRLLLEEVDKHFMKQAGFRKNNAAITASRTSFSASEKIELMEALPDVYHMSAAADQLIAANKKIKVDGVVYHSGEALMQAALPNAWPLLEGPLKGMKLIQHEDGTIAQIAHDAALPDGTKPVTSFREHNETFVAEKYSGPMEDLIPTRTPTNSAAAEEIENGAKRFLSREHLSGKTGWIIGGATAAVALCATVYGIHRSHIKKKAAQANEPWVERVAAPAAPQSPSL